VQTIEFALRPRGTDREWLAELDTCITRDSSLDIIALVLDGPNVSKESDKRILHLPVLWKKYYDGLLEGRVGEGESFWIAVMREATQKRLAVSRGEYHRGYSVENA
jgi:hypothetical protein